MRIKIRCEVKYGKIRAGSYEHGPLKPIYKIDAKK